MSTDIIAAAHASIARGSKSFALASRLFDPETRDRATLLYAWCRHCDDVIDGQQYGQGRMADLAAPAARLAELRAATDRAFGGEMTGDVPFDALALLVRDVAIPRRYADDLLHGFAMDVDEFPVDTEGDLLTYCYHVAGCVGVMMALVMGVSPMDHRTLARASDLGLAFQLANIARDVMEDAAAGRCYLPAEWLAAERLSAENFTSAVCRPSLHRVVSRLVTLSGYYEASAVWGVPALGWRQAWAVLAAARIYGDIGRKVRAGGTAALAQRVVTSRAEKLAAVAAALPAARARHRRWREPAPARQGLWTPQFVSG
ncbi:MAG: phytoene/squalene synthase family protein [Sphingomonadaceae bacterium]